MTPSTSSTTSSASASKRASTTVVDATNVQAEARRKLVQLAREYDVLPVAVVLDLPEEVCRARNATRPDRAGMPRHVVQRHRRELRRSLRGLEREGFRKVHVLHTEEEADRATVVRERRYNDLRHLTGPFDIIGDVHGCRSELDSLLAELGYADGTHPQGRTAVFVGDLVDRGPDSPGVLRRVMSMVASGDALCVSGNHENKLSRYLKGRKVQHSHGLAETIEQLEREDGRDPEFRARAEEFVAGLVSHYVLDGGDLVVCHAGLPEKYHGRTSGRVRSHALYGDTTGETDEFGLPVRYPWAEEYRGRAAVVYGHTPVPTASWVNNTLCLDTGAVFGGKLTALRWPEREIVGVPAEKVWYEPVRPLATEAPGGREGRPLDLGDVHGKRIVETRHMVEALGARGERRRRAGGDEPVRGGPPAAAVPPADHGPDRHLPRGGVSGAPGRGVRAVPRGRRHQGRVRGEAHGLPRRRPRLPGRGRRPGALRHGRADRCALHPYRPAVPRRHRAHRDAPRPDPGRRHRRRALGGVGHRLGPARRGAAPLVAEGRRAAALAVRRRGRRRPAPSSHAALAALEAAGGRGVDVSALAGRQRERAGDAAAFTEAYRRYCWSTEGLEGVRFAPFQVLAVRGRSLAAEPHDAQLAWLDRLVEHDPTGLLQVTRRLVVDTGDEESVRAGVDWWLKMTAAGAEGMVVKPLAALVRDAKARLVQPGIKVRGREYLRIIYGPEYTRPDHLERLRSRFLGHKRSLALREYALGLEALDRLAEGEPLWRVHEAVFAVLALESEPVDPRL